MNVEDLVWLRAVADSGSFRSAAGNRVAVSTVTRRIDALERKLGLRLVDRRANGISLTADGRRIAALAMPVVEASDRLARAASTMRTDPAAAPIVVSATEFFVAEILTPQLPLLLDGAHAIAITLRTQIGVVSLAAREADLAIRMTRPSGDSLVAQRVASMEIGLFASRRYLGRRGVDTVDLAGERLLVYDDGYGTIPENAWIETQRLTSAIVLRAGSTRALANAALAGCGIAILPAVLGRRLGLTELPGKSPPPRPAWVVVHSDLRRVPAVTRVRAWLVAACRRWFDEGDRDSSGSSSK